MNYYSTTRQGTERIFPDRHRRKLEENWRKNIFEASCVGMENNESDLKKKHWSIQSRDRLHPLFICDVHRHELMFTILVQWMDF